MPSAPSPQAAAVAANTSVPVTVTGTLTGVPATATAVVANVTAAGATAPSFLTVYPAGATMPTASNLNFGKQGTNAAIANRVTVGVGTTGQIEVYNHTGTVNVDVDIDGYYTGIGGTGSVFVPITPVRVADTRTASKVGTQTSLAANSSETFNIATTASAIPATATAVATNVTVVPGNAPGYLTVYPAAATSNPVASDINWTAGETPAVPNFTVADTAGTGNVKIYNGNGATVDVIVDADGYFAAAAASGPIMVSAVVTDTSITITYNEAVSCPTLVASVADFQYFWTGSASGGTPTSCTNGGTASPDTLTLAPTSPVLFTLPGGTGGSIVYTAPTTTPGTNNSVFQTGTTNLAATQTLSVAAGTAPSMVSAVQTGLTLLVTYNEDTTCSGTAWSNYVYTYTGVATDAVTGCSSSGDVVTLDLAADDAPAPGQIVYTAPTAPTSSTAVYATGSTPPLYAATQTLAGTKFTTPAMVSATVSSTQVAITYSEAMGCPATGADTDFVYDSTTGVVGGSFTGCARLGRRPHLHHGCRRLHPPGHGCADRLHLARYADHHDGAVCHFRLPAVPGQPDSCSGTALCAGHGIGSRDGNHHHDHLQREHHLPEHSLRRLRLCSPTSRLEPLRGLQAPTRAPRAHRQLTRLS